MLRSRLLSNHDFSTPMNPQKITDFSILEHIKNAFFYCGLERDVNNLPSKRNFITHYYPKVLYTIS